MPSRSKLAGQGLIALASLAAAGPCDIYAQGNTPCVAAHSTTRALYDSFNGALYQVKRNSDGSTTNINTLSAGGVANAASQDSFCSNTTCLISVIYDQSGRNNHLTQAPPGGAASGPNANGYDDLAAATAAPVTVNGHKAYGVFIHPTAGYRIDKTNGIATGDEPEGMYAIVDGSHYNAHCCFDYGNAETNNDDNGNGKMEAINFSAGDGSGNGLGAGSGPWIMADLENGLFSGFNRKVNDADQTIKYKFTTAMVKGGHNIWAIHGGNANNGGLSTFYNGIRPDGGYNPMQKEGAIILGIGGDNSNGGQGTFYEGCMTSGYPSDATESKVQANIVSANYAACNLTSGPAVNVGSVVSFRVTTPGLQENSLTHTNGAVTIQDVNASSNSTFKSQANWNVHTGLGNSACVSFESQATPGSFIRHYNYQLRVDPNDGSQQFAEDATFCPEAPFDGQGNALRSWSYPTRYFRHFNGVAYIASQGGPHDFDASFRWINDVSYVVSSSL